MSEQESLWNFSVNLYGKEDVKEACLSLQDEHGVDIPLLLFLIWVHENFNAEEEGNLSRFCSAAIDEVRDWQEGVVKPLRAARRASKNNPIGGAMYYEITKQVELEAEHRQLLHLERLAKESLARLDFGESNSKETLDELVWGYFEGLGVEKGDKIQSLLGVINLH